ncbi:hypothetical protein MJ575_26195 [Klebsiella pneumoniae]|nr:hypothetical protein MJ575_26195 [Klebsiella pneumoniae]
MGCADVYKPPGVRWLIPTAFRRGRYLLVAAPQGGDWRKLSSAACQPATAFPGGNERPTGYLAGQKSRPGSVGAPRRNMTWWRWRPPPTTREIVSGRHGRFYVYQGRVCRQYGSYKPYQRHPYPPYPVTVPGGSGKSRAGRYTVRRPPRSLTPCLQHSGIYSNKRKRSGMEQTAMSARNAILCAGWRALNCG